MKAPRLHTREQPWQFRGQEMALEGGKPGPCPEWTSTGLHKVSFVLHFRVFPHQESSVLRARLPPPCPAQKSDLKCFHQGPAAST